MLLVARSCRANSLWLLKLSLGLVLVAGAGDVKGALESLFLPCWKAVTSLALTLQLSMPKRGWSFAQPKGLEGRASFLISGEHCTQGVVWQQKYLYIHNTRQRGLWVLVFSCLGFFVWFRRQRVRVHLKSSPLNRACHCC